MFKIFAQYFVGGVNSFEECEDGARTPRPYDSDHGIDVVYDHVFSCRDERRTLEVAKEMALEALPTYLDKGRDVLVEVFELENRNREGSFLKCDVRIVENRENGRFPIHSFFIERTPDVEDLCQNV